MTLAEEIILYRAKNNLTQEDFAKMCGMSPVTILRAEKSLPMHKRTEVQIRLAMQKETEENDG